MVELNNFIVSVLANCLVNDAETYNCADRRRILDIIVDFETNKAREEEKAKSEMVSLAPFYSHTYIKATEMKNIQTAIAANCRINAIKEMRMATGFGLKDAKDLIDKMYPLPPRLEAPRSKTSS